MADFDYEVPGVFEPCRQWVFEEDRYCLNVQRAIEFVPANSGKKLVCGRGHAIAHNGKPFIPAWEFDDGGTFDGILPDELLPNQTRIKQTRWKIPRDAPIHRVERDKCIRCGTPPYDIAAQTHPAQGWAWLDRYAPELIDEIHAQLRAIPGARLASWFAALDQPLRKKLIQRQTMSKLAIDHGVPRKVGDQIWLLLSARERTFLQKSLLLLLCRQCNGAKSSRLLPREQLEALFIATYYDGSIAAAYADAARWTLLTSVLDKVYQQEALG